MSDDINRNGNCGTGEMTEENLTEQRQIRRQKLRDLQEAGRNPFLVEIRRVDLHQFFIRAVLAHLIKLFPRRIV